MDVNNHLGSIGGVAGGMSPAPMTPKAAPKADFAELLDKTIGEVSRLQQDASRAVENLAVGNTEDVTGVLTAVEKSDLAFKTLLAIRAKLMDAYEEIKSIQI